jgi:hypothetical protein
MDNNDTGVRPGDSLAARHESSGRFYQSSPTLASKTNGHGAVRGYQYDESAARY